MKEFWLFIKWQYNKLELWQKIFLVNMFIMGFTAFRSDEVSQTIFYITLMVPFVAMIKWFVIDQMIESWQRFKKEKSELFNTIREGK